MEPQYLFMPSLLMFIFLSFGIILLLYSELLRLHDRDKSYRLVLRITGVAFILVFLFQSSFVEFSCDFVFDWYRTSDEGRQVYTFSQDVAIWKKGVSEHSFLQLLVFFVVWFIFAFVGLFGMFMDFDIRKELKELDIFNVGRLAFFGVGIAISLLCGIFSLFQLGSFTLAIGYKLFY